MAPLVALLLQNGLGLLGNAVLARGKEWVEEKTGLNLDEAAKTPGGLTSLRHAEMAHEEELLKLHVEDNRIGAELEKVRIVGDVSFQREAQETARAAIWLWKWSSANAATYVAWNWKKGVTPGFDIVGYTGTGTVQTVAHSLGVAPGCVIYKNRSVAADWAVYHIGDNPASQPQYGKMLLNSTAAFSGDGPIFNDTAPSSSVFTVGVSALTNTSGNNYVAYLFAEVSGFSRIGRYIGNGSADGPFVWCGFKPKYVMIKRTDVVGYGWAIRDTARDTYNASVAELATNYSNAEGVAGGVDFLGNGWKLRLIDPAYNASGGNYIFVAFAEHPFKYAKAG